MIFRFQHKGTASIIGEQVNKMQIFLQTVTKKKLPMQRLIAIWNLYTSLKNRKK